MKIDLSEVWLVDLGYSFEKFSIAGLLFRANVLGAGFDIEGDLLDLGLGARQGKLLVDVQARFEILGLQIELGEIGFNEWLVGGGRRPQV